MRSHSDSHAARGEPVFLRFIARSVLLIVPCLSLMAFGVRTGLIVTAVLLAGLLGPLLAMAGMNHDFDQPLEQEHPSDR